MRYAASEKLEIIRLVEQSHLPVRETVEKLGVSRAACAALEAKSAQEGLVLTEAQLTVLEKATTEKEAHGVFPPIGTTAGWNC